MCTGVEIAMLASAAVGTVGTIYSGMQQAAAADDQAQIAENNAAYEADANKQQAEKIRRMAKAQRGEANAALAASGVKLGEGTPNFTPDAASAAFASPRWALAIRRIFSACCLLASAS